MDGMTLFGLLRFILYVLGFHRYLSLFVSSKVCFEEVEVLSVWSSPLGTDHQVQRGGGEREWDEGNKSEPSRGTPSSFGRLLFADLFSRARMGMGFLKMIDGQKGYLCCTWL